MMEAIDLSGHHVCIVNSIITIPIASMYGIFPYIYHKNQPNVEKYIPYMDPTG